MSDGRVVKGGTVPDMYGYHNNMKFSTKDKDNDTCGGSCSTSYGNGAWWYGCCWAGNFWGKNGSGHTQYTSNPYWRSSGGEYYSWGAIYVKNNGSAGDGSTKEKAAASCKKIRDDKLSRGNGVYWIDPTGGDVSDAFQVYCDMTSDGGGWTMVLKINGADGTFTQGSSYWTNDTLLNVNNIAEDAVNSKFKSYTNLAFGEVLLKMKTGDAWRTMVIPKVGNSMKAVMAAGYHNTGKGRAAWLNMVPGSAAQNNCGVEGFNNYNGGARGNVVRLGVSYNQENDCRTCDTCIGIGCTSKAAGNWVGCCNGTNGNRNISSIAYLYVR